MDKNSSMAINITGANNTVHKSALNISLPKGTVLPLFRCWMYNKIAMIGKPIAIAKPRIIPQKAPASTITSGIFMH